MGTEASECLENGDRLNRMTSSLEYSSPKCHGVDNNPSSEKGSIKASNVASSSVPNVHINEQIVPSEFGGRACRVPLQCGDSTSSFVRKDFLPCQIVGYAQRKLFPPHWKMDAVNEALEKGDIFRALFRVNAHNKLEAYCKIDGVPTDILVSGFVAQNRAVEGDIVAVKVDPLPTWTRMKGSTVTCSDSSHAEHGNSPSKVYEVISDSSAGKNRVDDSGESCRDRDCLHPEEWPNEYFIPPNGGPSASSYCNGHSPLATVDPCVQQNEAIGAIARLCTLISSYPHKRPTGRVVSIIEMSPRRKAVVGFLHVKQWFSYRESCTKDGKKKNSSLLSPEHEHIQLLPTDPKFPKMVVPISGLPHCIKKRLRDGDETLEMDLVAAQVIDWGEESVAPQAFLVHVFGRGGEIESQIGAILFENAIHCPRFSSESITCLPSVSWEVSLEEVRMRRDLRNLCIFTIDPSTATDLDDALSIELLSDGIVRVGVHIADVSYFVQPDSALDIEAQMRSTSVYMMQHKLPMLPPLLSENLGSLIPGVDRLAFSILWDINQAGNIVDRWIGRTVVHSCGRLSYEHAQGIIGGIIDIENVNIVENAYPKLHGHFRWTDVISSIRNLHLVSKSLKENRFKRGALQLDNSKVVFLFDEDGIPYDSRFHEQKDSNSLVEEFMLLANRTVAEVICRAFPDNALLRRHPEPNMRKLREFESFCSRLGLELDASSSGQLHHSLQRMREKLKHDSVLFDILISYASKPMQLASYFCTGDSTDNNSDWGHYALAIPLYTHFTSPLRRYPDLMVHRILAATIEAEEKYSERQKKLEKEMLRCFTGVFSDKDSAESTQIQEMLSAAALKNRVPCMRVLADIAAYCNERKLAGRYAEDACYKLYMWLMLKRKKSLLSEARVLSLGPRFMSIYIQRLAIERRIYYDEVEGLTVEWLNATSKLVLSYCGQKRFHKRGRSGKNRALEDVALVVNPCNLNSAQVEDGGAPLEAVEPRPKADTCEVSPAVFPMTLHLLSTISVSLYAIGGEDGPLDIGARLYISSYFA